MKPRRQIESNRNEEAMSKKPGNTLIVLIFVLLLNVGCQNVTESENPLLFSADEINIDS